MGLTYLIIREGAIRRPIPKPQTDTFRPCWKIFALVYIKDRNFFKQFFPYLSDNFKETTGFYALCNDEGRIANAPRISG